MESLPFALFIVMLELTVGSFISLYLLDLRGDSSRGFVIFQGALYLAFALLTLLAMNAFATPQLVAGRGLDERWLGAQGPLVLAFSLLMLPWNVLLWRDPDSSYRVKKKPSSSPPPSLGEGWGGEVLRLARYAVGGLAALAGVAALVVVAMAYRTLADSRLGGAFVVLALLAGALALGGVMTAMLLGHWYLNTPTASGKPLEFVTILMLGALAAELVLGLLIGPSTAHHAAQTIAPPAAQTALHTGQTGQHGAAASAPSAPTATATKTGQQPTPPKTSPAPDLRQQSLDLGAFQAMWIIMGLLAPLGLGAVALHLTRGRSFQSATGMLYLCVVFVFIGEILARGLLVAPIARF